MAGRPVRKRCETRKYIGQYTVDKKEGYGEFYWPDGRCYKGYWKDGKQHGRGVYKGNGKGQMEGEWQDGKLVRRLS